MDGSWRTRFWSGASFASTTLKDIPDRNAFQASGKVIASATLYGLGFYIWIILLAYWTEKNHRYTFLLKYELNNQMQATHHAKSAEQREAASKRRFVSYIFHEIRVPFNTAVLGFHNMEDEGAFKGLDESQKGSLDAIRSSFTMMESVLNDVLDFQKMEEGKFELQSRPFDLAAAVRASAYAFASTAYEKNIDLSTTIDARVLAFGATVLGDDIRYRQVLNNFISNALKFTPRDGRVAISVMVVNASGVTKDSKREVTIRTEVKDSGVGISKEDQEKMFQPYFQINSWGLQGGKGTGLGLAICKHIIQLAGGTCGVESTMGEGSTFWSEISLPLYDSTASIHSATSHQSIGSLAAHTTHVDRASSVLSVTPMTPPPGVPRSLHVLVVDDDKITRMMMSKLLKQMGHTFEIATDGQEALDIICNEPDVDVEPGGNGAIPIIVINPMESLNISNPGTTTSLTTLPAAPLPTPPLSPSTSRHTSRFNVILMDNQMPRLTGAEAVRALRERGIVTPVVGITGNALKEDQELFIQAGADLVITKPLKKEKLVNTLRLIV
ncbi:histidine kinase-like ATPase [Gaertneriomyces semiglobifer]|nr:histidine kinase-like ATPase [Gaertneriomyces semiglobifer]